MSKAFPFNRASSDNTPIESTNLAKLGDYLVRNPKCTVKDIVTSFFTAYGNLIGGTTLVHGMARLADLKVFVKDERIDSLRLYEDIKANSLLFGLLNYVNIISRGKIISKQIDYPEYCSLVPFVMGAFKKFHDIPYEKWLYDNNLKLLVSSDLFSAMSKVNTPTRALLLAERDIALYWGGRHNQPATTYAVYPKNEYIRSLPKLQVIMLLQVWCAHPNNRNKYMILDPNTWDSIPEALVSEEVLNNRAVYETPEWEANSVYETPEWEVHK